MPKLIKHSRDWSLGNLIMLASGLILIGICAYLIITPPRNNSPLRYPRNGQVTKSEAITTNYDVDYPIFHLEKIDAALRAYASKVVDDFSASLKGGKANPNHKLRLTYDVAHYGDRTATVVFNAAEGAAGKKPVTSQNIMTFDLQSQKRLAFADLFQPDTDARKALADLLYDYFKKTDASLTPLEQMKLLALELSNISAFSISDDAITIYVNLRNLPSNHGLQKIAIKKTLLTSVLKKEYAKTDDGRQPDMADKPAYAITKRPPRAQRITPGSKLIALTFDDGPGSYTPRLLDALRANKAHATFFVLGSLVGDRGDMLKRAIAEGNEIGNHSWNHPDLTTLPPDQLQFQIDQTQAVIAAAANGYKPVLMRPPYGAVNIAVTGFLQSRGLTAALWNVDPDDWLHRDAQTVYDTIMSSAGDGRVMVLHDIYASTVDGVTRALPDLTAQGYRLVTVSELNTL